MSRCMPCIRNAASTAPPVLGTGAFRATHRASLKQKAIWGDKKTVPQKNLATLTKFFISFDLMSLDAPMGAVERQLSYMFQNKKELSVNQHLTQGWRV